MFRERDLVVASLGGCGSWSDRALCMGRVRPMWNRRSWLLSCRRRGRGADRPGILGARSSTHCRIGFGPAVPGVCFHTTSRRTRRSATTGAGGGSRDGGRRSLPRSASGNAPVGAVIRHRAPGSWTARASRARSGADGTDTTAGRRCRASSVTSRSTRSARSWRSTSARRTSTTATAPKSSSHAPQTSRPLVFQRRRHRAGHDPRDLPTQPPCQTLDLGQNDPTYPHVTAPVRVHPLRNAAVGVQAYVQHTRTFSMKPRYPQVKPSRPIRTAMNRSHPTCNTPAHTTHHCEIMTRNLELCPTSQAQSPRQRTDEDSWTIKGGYFPDGSRRSLEGSLLAYIWAVGTGLPFSLPRPRSKSSAWLVNSFSQS